MKKTKIIATMGPSSSDIDVLRRIIAAGCNVCRINMSHSSHEDAREFIHKIRTLTDKVGILIDTRGPEIRTTVVDAPVHLVAGSKVIVRGGEGITTAEVVYINFHDLAAHVKTDTAILIADGQIEVRVQKIDGKDILCRVVSGGKLGSKKGVNIPSIRLPIPFMSEQDYRDVAFAVEMDADFIAASFVNDADNVRAIRDEVNKHGGDLSIISKIESRYAVDNLEQIIEASDAIMVARGDLGVEISAEEVPVVQKRIIDMSRAAGKTVIVATEMLESMIQNPRPTRAETSDVANAIFEGTDAVMLSGETSVGAYPVETVQMMSRIARIAEGETSKRMAKDLPPENKVTEIICRGAWLASRDMEINGILVPTSSGRTAFRMSRYRPDAPILATTPNMKIARRLALCYGVYALPTRHDGRMELMVRRSCQIMVDSGLLEREDLTVVVCGVPVGRTGTTNLLTVQRVADLLGKGNDDNSIL